MRYLSVATFLVLTCLLLAPASVLSESKDAKRLATEKSRAEEARRTLQKLSAKEREAHQDLAATEKRVHSLAGRVEAEEKELGYLRASEKDLAQTLAAMEKKRGKNLEELQELLRNLWPVQLRRDVLRGRTLPDWEQADREFVWMSSAYGRVWESYDALQRQEEAIRATLEQKHALAQQARKRLAALNNDKDKLLEERLGFRRELASVRKRKLSQEEELEAIMTLVDELDYKLEQEEQREQEKLAAERQKAREQAAAQEKKREAREKKAAVKLPFNKQQGKLPWPVRGKVVAGYSPNAKPPNRGLGFSLQEEAPVHAVSWGRVVHNEVLRGFGRVVILLHGGDYYSVYAFLSSSDVKKGQEVAQGQPIGSAGYYPKAKGPGVYFELRFHQKPINPRQWLIAQN